jgi:hypothetical protein
MDILALLSQAKINDMDGVELGDVMGIHFVAGKMIITVNMNWNDESEDPDGGEKEDIPEDDVSKMEFPKIVAMGQKVGVNG